MNNKKHQEQIQSISENEAGDLRELEVQRTTSSNIFKIRDSFFNQLFAAGSLFFLAFPASTWICVNWIEETN